MKKYLKSMLLLFIGVTLYCTVVNLFLQPNNIVAGGFSGLAVIVYDVTGISTSAFYFVSNVILLILAMIFLGKTFVGKAIIGATIMYPIMLAVIPVQQMSSDPLINVVVSGTLFGIANVFVYHSGGSAGGTNILGNIVHKYTSMSFGSSVSMFDLMIMILGFMVFGFEACMYGIFIIVIATLVTNYGIAGFRKLNQVQVISNNFYEITSKLNEELGRGVTLLDGTGGYTNESKKVVMCVVNNSELKKVKDIIYTADEKAFVIVSQVSTTYGEGFDILIP